MRTAGAALATAACLALALPDAGLWPLVFVAWTPLLLVLPDLSPWRALLAGWLAGALANAVIFHWIAHTAITMSDFHPVAAAGVLCAYVLWAGLALGVAALLARPLALGALAPVSVPAAVVLVEWLWPHLFPWHLGNAFYRTPLLLQGMDVTGVYGGTFVAVSVSAAMSVALRSRGRAGLVPAAVAAALLAAWVGYGAVRLAQVRDAQPRGTLRLALVQPDITAEDKKHKDAASRKALFARLGEMTLSADLSRVDAVVWPEGTFPFYFALDPGGRNGWENIVETSHRLVALVQQVGRPLVFGTLTRPGAKARNSMVMLDKRGAEVARYDKRKLLAFGEYMPLADVIPGLKGAVKEVSDMEAGDRAIAFPIGDARAVASICYEAILPSFTRDSVNETGADLVLNVTNDAWFGESGAPAQHLMVQVPRAVELRVPLVRSTQTGITAVVLESGEFIHETGLHERRVDLVEVPWGRDVTSPYRALGDLFALLCAACTPASLWLAYRRGKKSRSTSTG